MRRVAMATGDELLVAAYESDTLEAMERHKHLQLAPDIRARLLAMSAATIDRALRTPYRHEPWHLDANRPRHLAPPHRQQPAHHSVSPRDLGYVRAFFW